jgi:hypothetical protein
LKYLLNVDYLEFRANTTIHLTNFLSGGIYKFSNALSLEIVKDYSYLKQNYSCCFKIWYENIEIGFIWTKSLELGYENGLNTMVRLDNKVFYVYGLGLILKVIVEALGLKETTIKRLDVCYDTDFDVLSRFKTLYYDASTKFRLRNKIKVKGTGRDDDELTIGSLTSRTKCISIYNKTKEINNSHKEYIRNLHKEIFGLKFIYRVELRLFSRTMEIKDIDIMKLESTDYLETIFNTYFANLVQFIDVNNGEKIEFITLNNTGLKLQRVIKQKVNGGTRQVKGVINFLDRECKTTEFYGVKRIWKQLRSILLKKYGLETWDLTKK